MISDVETNTNREPANYTQLISQHDDKEINCKPACYAEVTCWAYCTGGLLPAFGVAIETLMASYDEKLYSIYFTGNVINMNMGVNVISL